MSSVIEILLVEDSPSDVILTEEALKLAKFSYNLSIKHDGVQAMDYLNELKGLPDSRLPDIILLDLNMPKLNGHEVLLEMSRDEVLRTIPVVLLTVSERDDDIMDALRSKMNYYVAKPVTDEKLSTIINAIHELQTKGQDTGTHTNDETHIRLVLAGNPHTSAVALRQLANDSNERVRSRVAENANLPLDVFQKLVQDSSVEVRTSVGENRKAPAEVYEFLARDSSDDVRLALSTNAQLPVHLLQLLEKDDNIFVAESAKKTRESTTQKVDAF